MTTRISLLLTGACVFATACSDDGRADTEANTDVGSGSVSVSGGVTEADTDPTPTSTPTSTPGDPSGDTPGSASNVTDATDGTTTVDPSGTTVMTSADTDTGDDPIVEVVIDPLDAIVTVVDGQIPAPLQYTAKGITMMGVEVPLERLLGLGPPRPRQPRRPVRHLLRHRLRRRQGHRHLRPRR
jgi:hypothetical protein